MRRSLLVGVVSSALMACGIFGSTDDPPKAADPTTDPAQQPPSTPQDNAQPPPAVGGAAPAGVFVSSSLGADDGSGSSVRPVKTLKRAFEIARDQKLRVIACAEPYAENLTLIDGVSAYGYYDCKVTPWVRGTTKAVINAPNSPAVVASGITQMTRIEGFEMRAPDLDGAPATDTSGTSIALQVTGSSNLTIGESLLHAGKGAPGTDGTDGPVNSRTNVSSDGAAGYDQTARTCPPPVAGGVGNVPCTARIVAGPAGGLTTCAIGPNGGPGGQGGDPRWYALGVESTGTPYELRGRPLVATPATAAGGPNASPTGLFGGVAGTNGAAGTEGTDGANGAWSLTTTGFVRGNGTAGGLGNPGQGGGGGGSTKNWMDGFGNPTPIPTNGYYDTAGGGGGGAGGCAGHPGTPGTGGGASVGALVIDSVIAFEGAHLESSDGGRAGKGNLGTPSTAAGKGGAGIDRLGSGFPASVAGKGGDGGAGGNGGASGHGAPGPSIALAYKGAHPTLTTTDLAPGVAGAGQPQLKRTVGGAIGDKLLPAVTGVSEAEHQIQ